MEREKKKGGSGRSKRRRRGRLGRDENGEETSGLNTR